MQLEQLSSIPEATSGVEHEQDARAVREDIVNDFPGVTQVVYDSEARNKREGFRPGEICLSAVYCRGIYTYR